MAKKFRFNLLRKEVDTLLSKIVFLFTNYARYIIILVQIFVLLVFFLKIALDQTIIDLKEAIDQKNQIILSSESMINTNNALYEKIYYVNKIFQEMDKEYQGTQALLNNIPKSVSLQKLDLNLKEIVSEGETNQPTDLKKMESRISKLLNKEAVIQSVSKNNFTYKFVFRIVL